MSTPIKPPTTKKSTPETQIHPHQHQSPTPTQAHPRARQSPVKQRQCQCSHANRQSPIANANAVTHSHTVCQCLSPQPSTVEKLTTVTRMPCVLGTTIPYQQELVMDAMEDNTGALRCDSLKFTEARHQSEIFQVLPNRDFAKMIMSVRKMWLRELSAMGAPPPIRLIRGC